MAKFTPQPSTPLTDCSTIIRNDFSMHEVAYVGKLILRGRADDTQFSEAISNTLSLSLPTTPNTITTAGDTALLWLGPEEWLLWSPDEKRQQHLTALTTATAAVHAAVVDVSDYYTIIRLSGKNATAVLAHGCPLDFRHAVGGVGQCAQSRYQNAAILLARVDDKPTFDIQIRWSFAQYLWDYLRTINDTVADC